MLSRIVPTFLYSYQVLLHTRNTYVLFIIPIHCYFYQTFLQIRLNSFSLGTVGYASQLLSFFSFDLLLFFLCLCLLLQHLYVRIVFLEQTNVLLYFILVFFENFKGSSQLPILLFLDVQMNCAQILPVLTLLLCLLTVFPSFLLIFESS